MIFVLGRDQNLLWSIYLKTDQERGFCLSEEQFAFILTNVEDGVVAPRFVHERNVHVCWQTFVD